MRAAAADNGLVPVVQRSACMRPTRDRRVTSTSWLALALALAAGAGAPWPSPAGASHPWYVPVLTIDPESLRKLAEARPGPVPIDLRPVEQFRRGHLPGARSLPLAQVRERIGEIPRDGLVVLYCDCQPLDVNGVYQFLRGRGYHNVFVLEDGIAAWRARGYPLER
jgi:rhodanese-related sulfurtransferase